MSDYYNPQKTWGLYSSGQLKPFRISRSKIDLFIKCPHCFYLDCVLGVKQPPGYPFSLNSAVDKLLKKEFDFHRAAHTPHPLMKTYGIDAVPFEHPKMDEWRDSMRRGVTYVHEPTNLLITGGVDDIWVNPEGELIVVDYKATAKDSEVSLDAEWQDGYKRQMEVYQWLLRQNGFNVSDTGYFVYCNGKTDREAFDGRLEFDVVLFPYSGNTDWIERTIYEIHKCLNSREIPAPCEACDYCRYRVTAKKYD